MKKTNINLIPDVVNPSPDYYCTWQTQLYATCDGKPEAQRACIGEKALFLREKPYGWAYFYEKARKDLIFVMDDSWDVPLDGNPEYYGSLQLSPEKFPSYATGKSQQEALKSLCDKIKELGWKGLGGWICAQESQLFINNQSTEEYWIERLNWSDYSDFKYWKVDWGKRSREMEFRTVLAKLALKHAPKLVVENAIIKETVSCSDVFRTYDVPAIMSIPMTMNKLLELSASQAPQKGFQGLVNCEDEVYIAAAGGFTMGIMRHPYVGDFVNGKTDMSFPDCHRRIKTKMAEVIRAVRWHRIAPAFAMDANTIKCSESKLCDTWIFENVEGEIEEWWLRFPMFAPFCVENKVTIEGCAMLCRNLEFPHIIPDEEGELPYVIAAKNPNGVVSVATCGRTKERRYWTPKCDICIQTGDTDTVGVFGQYRSLSIQTEKDITDIRILAQDLAGDIAYDITEYVKKERNIITISGELIEKIGTMAQDIDDTSEPGMIIKLV